MVVRLTANLPQVLGHRLAASRRVLLRVERLEILCHVAQVFATELHRCRYCCEASTCVDGVLGLRDVVTVGVLLTDVQTRAVRVGGCCRTVRTDQVVATLVTLFLFRLSQRTLYVINTRGISNYLTRPMLDDSRVPHPLETPPIEYIPRMKGGRDS